MKLAVLFSGGKDSTFALFKARQQHEVSCLISIISENKESYMFHTPNIDMTRLQAEAIGLPLIQKKTKGEKEAELDDLKAAIIEAMERYGIEGVVTGAIRSVYQAGRVQKICKDLNIWCFNPLWLQDQVEHLNDIVNSGMKVIISGVFAEPLDESYLGKIIDAEMVARLEKAAKDFSINPAGEGGEIETTVIDAPFFKKRIEITNSDIDYEDFSGTFNIKGAKLVEKGEGEIK